jgi:hypothetical protein
LLGVTFDQFQTSDDYQVLGNIGTRFNISHLPDFSPSSYFTLFRIYAGSLQNDFNDAKVRWRANLFDADVGYRNYFYGGLTVLDLDKATARREEFRWAEVRFGGFKQFGKGRWAVSPVLSGIAGYASTKFGTDNFVDFDAISNTRYSGMYAGYRASLAINVTLQTVVAIEFKQDRLFAGPDPERTTIAGEAVWRTGARGQSIATIIRIEHDETDLPDLGLKQSNDRVTFGIQLVILPMATR